METDLKKIVGHRLQMLRMEKNLTQEQMGEKLNLSTSAYCKIEYGSPKKPAIAEAVALSMADNIDAKLETLRECFEAKDTNDWLGFNRWLDSNIRRTSF